MCLCGLVADDPDVSTRSGYDMITGLETGPDTTEERAEHSNPSLTLLSPVS